MFELISSAGKPFVSMIAASGGVLKGQLVKAASNEVTPIAAAHTGETIVGLCMADTDAGALAPIANVAGQILRIPIRSGITKTTIVAADYGKLYDIVVTSGDMVIDLDDTTGGFLYPVHPAPAGFADVMVASTLLLF